MPKRVESAKFINLEGQQLKIYNYVLANKSITTSEVEEMVGVKDRRARKILADMCDAGILMKVGATSSLKYVLKE